VKGYLVLSIDIKVSKFVLSGKITFVVCVKPLFFMISSRIALSRGC
jgi:hypothetical protein